MDNKSVKISVKCYGNCLVLVINKERKCAKRDLFVVEIITLLVDSSLDRGMNSCRMVYYLYTYRYPEIP